MINKNKDSRYFRTSTYYLASFLFAKGMELVGINDTSDARRKEFVFHDTPDRELLVNRYRFASENDTEVMVDVRKFTSALKTLKERIYSDGYK